MHELLCQSLALANNGDNGVCFSFLFYEMAAVVFRPQELLFAVQCIHIFPLFSTAGMSTDATRTAG